MSAMNEVTQEMLERLNTELACSLVNAHSPSEQAASLRVPNNSSLSHLLRSSNPEAPQEIARLDSILAFLTPNVPRGDGSFFDPTGNTVDQYWLGVVWAVAGLGWRCGKEKVRTWSMQSTRYTELGFEEAWEGFNPNHVRPVGMGSLIKFAKAKGWRDTSNSGDSVNNARSEYRLLSREDILALPVTPWRVKKIFPETGLGAIYGPSASGKSFLAMDIACSIAIGETWFGHKTYPCPVTYLMLEGEAGLVARIKAWEAGKGGLLPSNFHAITQPFQLTNLGNLTDLLAVLPKNGVVFLDTLNRAAPTADENSSAEMGGILQAAKNLQLATDGLVIVVHHTGKDVTSGMRGHSSLFAALDGAIEIQRSDEKRSWSVAKSKDAEDGAVVPFRLTRHVLGQDADGEEITSCTVEPDTPHIFTPREPSGSTQKVALKAVRQALMTATHFGIAGCGTGTPCMTVEDAKTAIAAVLTTTKRNKRMNQAKTQIDALIARGFLGTDIDEQGEGWIWRL